MSRLLPCDSKHFSIHGFDADDIIIINLGTGFICARFETQKLLHFFISKDPFI